MLLLGHVPIHQTIAKNDPIVIFTVHFMKLFQTNELKY